MIWSINHKLTRLTFSQTLTLILRAYSSHDEQFIGVSNAYWGLHLWGIEIALDELIYI